MTITIRPATLSDVPSLEIIRRQAIEDAYSSVYERSRFADLVAGADTNLPREIERESSIALVAESPITQLAYVVCDRDQGELLSLYTAPDYQGRGYATDLLRTVENSLPGRGTSRISVWSPTATTSFFRDNGYESLDGYREDPVPRIRLTKPLSQTG